MGEYVECSKVFELKLPNFQVVCCFFPAMDVATILTVVASSYEFLWGGLFL